MKWKLVYTDAALGKAWREHFDAVDDIEVLEGDICRVACDAVVSPANSFGFMDGGLDYALSERFGWDLQKRLQAEIRQRPLGELLVGEALIVETRDAEVPWLISAPTMRVPMRLKQSINAYLAMKAILTAVRAHQRQPRIEVVAVPGLGTGCGRLPLSMAAFQMKAAYEEVVLGDKPYPADYREAQSRQLKLNRR